jgi:KDO2-lipid IV(A) lauroyltransferase
MAKKRSAVGDFAVYFLVRCVVCLVQALPWSWALGLAHGLAWLAFRVDRRHRLVAVENIQHAFADLDAAAVDRIVRACYLHSTTMLMEMIRLPRVLHRNNLFDYVHHVHADDHHKILAFANCGRARMVLTGHFGNWEIITHVAGLAGIGGGIVARRLDNPHLDRFLAGFRRRTGLTVLDKTDDYRQILDILANGGGVGMVGDQDAGPRGLFVDFFGRPASTFKSIALLSLEYGAPICVLGAARIGQPMQYRLYFEDLIDPEEYAGRPDAARAITQRYTEALERMVRRHPEQYFWLHRRWKSPPAVKKAKKAAA